MEAAPTPAAPAPAPVSVPLVEEAVGPNAVLDAAIKRAVICGEFEGAVDCCFRFGRMADALLLAGDTHKHTYTCHICILHISRVTPDIYTGDTSRPESFGHLVS